MLSDLAFVLRHIKAILEEYNLSDLYSNFTNALQQISQSSTEELQEQLKSYKKSIKEAHDRLEPKGWSYSQIQILKKFGAWDILGRNGYSKFIDALSDNSANTPGAIKEIGQQREDINKLLINSTNVLSSLGDLAEEMEVEKDQSVVQIVFDEDVKIDTVSDLLKQSQEWKKIIAAYSRLAGESPDKTTIVATSKGSPYTMWLVTAKLIGETICATIKPFVDLYRDILEAKRHALVLEDMKVGIDGKKFQLFEAIDEFQRKRVMEITEGIAGVNANESLSEEEKNEAKNALRLEGPKLYNFITRGGKIDVSKPTDGNVKVFSDFQLEQSYQDVHQLRDDVQKLLVEKTTQKKEEKPGGVEEQGKKRRGRPRKSGD